MKPLRFAMLGAGFWSHYQLRGWQEVGGVECVALYNRTASKARDLAEQSDLKASIYGDARELLRTEKLDFVDIVTNAETHAPLVEMAAEEGVAVVCQKPMAPTLTEARRMVSACRASSVPFFVHENWRWQSPIRALAEVAASGAIGKPYRARLRMVSAFPVFENQPFLKTLERFLLLDIGSHILDVARFLFGEPESVYCCTQRVQQNISGEDVATVILRFPHGPLVTCEMGYAGTPLEVDRFPQTFAFLEGSAGSVELAPDYVLRTTTAAGTKVTYAPPPRFPWADPFYEVVHASIVPCHADLLRGLRGERPPETTADDNLRTMTLVFAAYESAQCNQVIRL